MRKCPICAKSMAGPPGNPWSPFCSERCKLIDLGKWMGEAYRLPTANREEREEAPEPPEDEPTKH